ncbi:hypothetical protein C8F01DRAFT_985247 [Mycena amicta]|nr:hypothetical protein C8F01DRAFT_985247 [Mycena amicta]
MSVATLSSSPPQPFRLHLSPTKTRSILDNDPVEVVDIALSRLQAVDVKLIEWQDLVYRRMNVPAITTNFCYLVPDSLVAQASKVLTDLGLPFLTPTQFEMSVYGDLAVRGYSHRITQSTSSALVQRIILYPQSFSTLADCELETRPPIHTTSPRCSTILVPTASAVYASILRLMLQYNQFDPMMYELRSQLSQLIGYHLLGLSGGYVEDEDWERLDVDGRISDAVHLVRSWGVDQVWRDGEEWMGDALAEVVRTGHIENLPYKPKTA